MINVFRPFIADPSETLSIESLTRDVHLKPIHSHNDYWRKRPFIDALSYGCTSIEGDIWRFTKDYTVTDTSTHSTAGFKREKIYVGHNQVHLKPENTIEKLYLSPLFRLLESANKKYSEKILNQPAKKFGVFFDSPESTLNLWFDLKTNGSDTYLALKEHLKPFSERQYLASYDNGKQEYVDGPVAVTLTGDVPWSLIEEEDGNSGLRNVFLDCPLHKIGDANEEDLQRYSRLCLFASASLQELIGEEDYRSSLRQDFNEVSRAKLKQSFDAAHTLGIKTRVWGGVDWPIHVRDEHWRSLWELGCDLINADDLQAAAEKF
ncbi:hypothetical protein JCM33374_g374 [Metschnikowia sp. JCM 33374]|nr:hypothetical protein JCM33374_g374 [Metschnikowia sp. JCM 33374]